MAQTLKLGGHKIFCVRTFSTNQNEAGSDASRRTWWRSVPFQLNFTAQKLAFFLQYTSSFNDITSGEQV